LILLEVWLRAFRRWDWDQGAVRGALLFLGLVGLACLRLWPRRGEAAPALTRWAMLLLAALVVAAFGRAVYKGTRAVLLTARTGTIELDQGQNTYRAALGLLRGENPYGRGALLDPIAYRGRLAIRQAAGVGPAPSVGDVNGALDRYWANPDPVLRAALLPTPPPGSNPDAVRETSLLGYKYGPVPLLLTAPLAVAIGPASVPLLNLLLYVGWLAALAAAARAAGVRLELTALALLAVLADPHPTWNYLANTASDIWPLAFSSVAVVAWLRQWHTVLGVALGLALASKLFPAALFLPLLIAAHSRRAVLVFALTAAALLGPWLLWDAHGFALNVLLWPTLMVPDTTSWVAYVSHPAENAMRLALLGLCGAVLLRLALNSERRLFWALAVANLAAVAAGSAIHNNYLPWFSAWAALAVIEPWTRHRSS
jgi:hypothetical protein